MGLSASLLAADDRTDSNRIERVWPVAQIPLREGCTMAVTVRKAVLGRKEIDNRPGVLAATVRCGIARLEGSLILSARSPGL